VRVRGTGFQGYGYGSAKVDPLTHRYPLRFLLLFAALTLAPNASAWGFPFGFAALTLTPNVSAWGFPFVFATLTLTPNVSAWGFPFVFATPFVFAAALTLAPNASA
jgi:hypothetical protein